MGFKRHIPNILTSLNMVCGSAATAFILRGELVVAASLVFLAAVFDFLDGALARALHAKSAFGKELDSLADVVSFGLAPGLLLFTIMEELASCRQDQSFIVDYLPFTAMLIPVFSALRLARFNLDETQTHYFRGLPTPANGIVLVSLPFIMQDHAFWSVQGIEKVLSVVFDVYFLAAMAVILSLFLISGIPLLSMKFKSLRWKGNEARFILLGLSVILLLIFNILAVPMIFLAYVVISLVMRKSVTGIGVTDD